MNNTGKIILLSTVAALFFLWKDRDDDGDDPPGNNNIEPDEPAPTASKPIPVKETENLKEIIYSNDGTSKPVALVEYFQERLN